MRNFQRRRAVTTDAAGDDFAVFDDRINVKNIAFDKFFDQKLRRMIAPGISRVNSFKTCQTCSLRLAFSDSESIDFRARFNNPRRGNRF